MRRHSSSDSRNAGEYGEMGRWDDGKTAIKLSDVTIECGNEFASIMVISLDGEPLARSKRILIQAMTQEQPYGFRVEGNRITDVGGAPFGVQNIAASVSLSFDGPPAANVVALDENGYASDKRVTTSGDGVRTPLVIHLARDAIYHVIERR